MKKLSGFLMAGLAMFLLFGCGGGTVQPEMKAAMDTEELIQTSQPQRPVWTMSIPDAEGGKMFFVGTSDRYKTEASARESAGRGVTEEVVKYMGTLVKKKFEEAKVSYGQESDAIDPTAAAREFTKQLATNMAKRVKVKEYYFEKYRNPTGSYFQYFALGYVPTEEIDLAYKDTVKNMAREANKAAQKAKEENDEFAKRQAEKQAAFFKDMQEQGLIE
ncbi:MAG: hypothetical protein P1P74_01590 [Desulfuromonadales bacterium]|nr:hypothetical protein [Desulfuromonadales bacterium]MDT8423319.1 hypothetical protein [Desulfuromonadales bacterium]